MDGNIPIHSLSCINLMQPKDILESYSTPRLDGENYRGQQAFLYIEQLQYNQSRSEPKLDLGVSRSRSEPHSSMSKTSGADRSRQSSKGPDRSGSTFEQIVHLCRSAKQHSALRALCAALRKLSNYTDDTFWQLWWHFLTAVMTLPDSSDTDTSLNRGLWGP